MQLTPPDAASVLVTEPDPHAGQLVCPLLGWYWPAAHSAHATVEALLY